MFNGLASSMEPLYRALWQWVEEARAHMCYLSMRAEGGWRLLPAVVTSKLL